MHKLMFKIGGTIATGAIIASGFAGAAFADNTISGNGAGSANTITVTNSCTATVIQSNDSDINVKIKQQAYTGSNEASSNTGGNVTITTGDIDQAADITVGGSSNTAQAPSCCGCQEVSSSATISGNGEGTNNAVVETTLKATVASQTNKTTVRARVKQKAKTGKNKANSNTNGTTDVTTGGITAGATVGVTGSTNNLP